MLDAVLKKYAFKIRITVKGAISLLCIALAIGLPQIAHVAGGATAGARWLPMYLPVLLAGCVLGSLWGVGVGIASPVASFGFTSLIIGNAMPVLARLPYMIVELAVFGLVSGLLSRKIEQNSLFAFPAVLCAQVAGRLVNLIVGLIAGQNSVAAWNVIQSGLIGLYVQALVVPFIAIILAKVVKNDDAR
ncbi:MAG: hypothetical protein K2L54_00715 [Clostridiales bacterium]|nr:hypothetical protein [Clostridiales bacterium]